MKPILFDCDDVLLNWIEGFRSHLEREYGVVCDGPEPDSWHMGDWTGLGDKRTYHEIEVFNEQSPHFSELKPIPGSVEVVQELKSLGHELHVITSCSQDPACIKRRHANLANVFGDVFGDIHCVPLGTPKTEYLKLYKPGFWIEDNVKNALLGHELGHKTIIRKVTHNRSKEGETPDGVIWVDDWPQIRSTILADEAAVAA